MGRRRDFGFRTVVCGSQCWNALLLFCNRVKVRLCYEKVGEATEAALLTLVEKLNVTDINSLALNKKRLCYACRAEVSRGWKKVNTLYVILFLFACCVYASWFMIQVRM